MLQQKTPWIRTPFPSPTSNFSSARPFRVVLGHSETSQRQLWKILIWRLSNCRLITPLHLASTREGFVDHLCETQAKTSWIAYGNPCTSECRCLTSAGFMDEGMRHLQFKFDDLLVHWLGEYRTRSRCIIACRWTRGGGWGYFSADEISDAFLIRIDKKATSFMHPALSVQEAICCLSMVLSTFEKWHLKLLLIHLPFLRFSRVYIDFSLFWMSHSNTL